MYFDFELMPVQMHMFEAAMVCLAVSLLIFIYKIFPVVRRRKACDESASVAEASENASVIVYSADECAMLESLLPVLLTQEYAGQYEVIVVNEGESARVAGLVQDLRMRYPNLYLTYTPDGARSLSRKKLALTLGIKAARYDTVVLTRADAVIDSRRWLTLMMRNFRGEGHTEVVLGWATAAPYDDRGAGARARSFDYVVDGVHWIGDALAGHPWRGNEYNLAYRRDLFFRNKGFSRHLNLRQGDDDIFVKEIATAANTAVELSAESFVEIPGNNTARATRERRASRRFTRRFIRRPRLVFQTALWCYCLGLILPLVAGALDYGNAVSWAGAGICLVLWYPIGLLWSPAMKALGGRRLFLTLPFLAATRPLRLSLGGLTARFHRRKRFTWE